VYSKKVIIKRVKRDIHYSTMNIEININPSLKRYRSRNSARDIGQAT
jgi:hypothetical protein